MHRRRIDHDEIAEAALDVRETPWALRENAPVVPVAVLVLRDADDRTLDLETLEEDASVEEVADVVLHRDRPGGDEQRVIRVADLDRVDRHPAQHPAADRPDVHGALHLGGDPRLEEIADLVATVARARHRREHEHPDDADREHRQRAHQGDETAAGHDVRTPGRSKS
jgi:hypothetical protein